MQPEPVNFAWLPIPPHLPAAIQRRPARTPGRGQVAPASPVHPARGSAADRDAGWHNKCYVIGQMDTDSTTCISRMVASRKILPVVDRQNLPDTVCLEASSLPLSLLGISRVTFSLSSSRKLGARDVLLAGND